MIRVENLVKRFGEFTAVDHISFEVGKGEIFAFLGPNGAGKTTTIKILTTLLQPTSGRFEIDGLDGASHPHEVRRRFGIVFQDPSLDGDMTAAENMELHGVFYHVPRKTRIARTEELLRAVRALGAPQRTGEVLLRRHEAAARDRARAAPPPQILFLDEPTLGLDPQTRNQLWTHVKNLNQSEGTTVFLTTHYMDEAERVAQRIAIIDHGKIVAQDSPEGLKNQTGAASLEDAYLALTGSTIRDESHQRRSGSAAAVRQNVESPPMSAIYILWLRELRRYVRSRAQIVASLGQPLMYLIALGFGLGPVFQKAGEGSYLQFIAPGVVSMTVLFSSVFSGMGLLWDRQFGFLKETLVAPVPRIQIMLGRTLGAATVAVIQGLLVMAVCFIAGFRVHSLATLPLALLFMALIACAFSALGTAIGSALENMQGFQLIMNFLVMPIFFLSGALYPLTNLPAGFQAGGQPRSAGVWSRRPARARCSASRISEPRIDAARAGRRRGRSARHRQPPVLAYSGLTCRGPAAPAPTERCSTPRSTWWRRAASKPPAWMRSPRLPASAKRRFINTGRIRTPCCSS